MGRSRLAGYPDPVINITGEEAVDELLTDDALALLIGMVLDQQMRQLQSAR